MKIPGFMNQGVTVRKRWTGLATTLALLSSALVLNGTLGAEAHDAPGQPWTIFAAGDVADAYNPRLGRHIRVEHWANARRQGATAGKAMLGQDAVDARPSYFFTDQYDLSMEYTGDIGPSGYDQVIFRRHADPASSSSSGSPRNASRPA
jgi:3-phenylpropionate/trans-cinnamate dioxygenase ferredoxin reductase subunit